MMDTQTDKYTNYLEFLMARSDLLRAIEGFSSLELRTVYLTGMKISDLRMRLTELAKSADEIWEEM
jgi:hypothetical protein